MLDELNFFNDFADKLRGYNSNRGLLRGSSYPEQSSLAQTDEHCGHGVAACSLWKPIQ